MQVTWVLISASISTTYMYLYIINSFTIWTRLVHACLNVCRCTSHVYLDVCDTAIFTLLGQQLRANVGVGDEDVWSLENDHLDHTAIVEVRVEAGVPLGVDGLLALNQLHAFTCRRTQQKRRTRDIITKTQTILYEYS